MALSSRRRMYSIDPQIGVYRPTEIGDLLTSHGYEGLLPYLRSSSVWCYVVGGMYVCKCESIVVGSQRPSLQSATDFLPQCQPHFNLR